MRRISGRRTLGHPQLAIYAQDLIGQAINVYGWWEHEYLIILRQFILEAIGRGGAMLDIGANIGNHSVYLSDLFDEVHAIEANPRTFKLLAFNAEPHPHLRVHQFAASDVARSVHFQIESTNVGASRVVDAALPGSPTRQRIEVPAHRIDDRIKPAFPVRLVKIDVEGHELQAIHGMSAMLTTYFPCVVFEQLQSEFTDGSSPVIETLRGFGYSRFFSVERSPSWGRGGVFNQIRSNLQALWSGLRMDVVETTYFRPRFYEMIIATKD